VIGRLVLAPREDRWYASVAGHLNADRPDPRAL